MLTTGGFGRAPVALCLVVAALGPATSRAAATLPPQASLEAAATNLARMWERGSTDVLVQVLVASGIRLRVGGEDHVSLSRRQTIAVLRDYLAGHRTESTRLARVAEVGGSPLQGYAELRWIVARGEASQAVEHGIYVGFVREDEAWRVFEIRVLQ